jgi:hypothetical protein
MPPTVFLSLPAILLARRSRTAIMPAGNTDRPEGQAYMNSAIAYCLARRNAVSQGFLCHVTELTQRNLHLFQENASPSRKYLLIENVTADGDQVLFSAKRDLAEYFGLGEYVAPPILKDFIGYITEGGFVAPHTDPDLPGWMHVRINVLITQPSGCVPLIDDIPIAIAVGDAWLNLASRCVHATTPAVGPGYRSVISFGYQISPERGDELYQTVRSWMSDVGRSPLLACPHAESVA